MDDADGMSQLQDDDLVHCDGLAAELLSDISERSQQWDHESVHSDEAAFEAVYNDTGKSQQRSHESIHSDESASEPMSISSGELRLQDLLSVRGEDFTTRSPIPSDVTEPDDDDSGRSETPPVWANSEESMSSPDPEPAEAEMLEQDQEFDHGDEHATHPPRLYTVQEPHDDHGTARPALENPKPTQNSTQSFIFLPPKTASEQEHICPTCQHRFQSAYQLRRHIEIPCQGLTCPDCGRRYARAWQLASHLKGKVPGVKKRACVAYAALKGTDGDEEGL
jgi:hypothetical protein